MRMFLIAFNLLAFIRSFAQTDTIVVKEKRGFLFLSAYNYMYDYDATSSEIKTLGFHDFFFPLNVSNIDLLKGLRNIDMLNNGLRVDFFERRQIVRKNAETVTCLDTSKCYAFGNFYIIPVVVSYKQFKDYEPIICGKSFYELLIYDKQLIRFMYTPQAIVITSIKVVRRKK